MRRGWGGAGFAVAVLLWAGAARAQTCTVSATGLSFGVYSPLSATPSTMTGTIMSTCQGSVGVLVTIKIQIGAGSGGSFAARSLSSGSYRLGYQIYTDPGLSSVWGDGTSGTNVVTNSYLLALGPVSASAPVYGRIPALQNVGVGNYTDMLPVLVTY